MQCLTGAPDPTVRFCRYGDIFFQKTALNVFCGHKQIVGSLLFIGNRFGNSQCFHDDLFERRIGACAFRLCLTCMRWRLYGGTVLIYPMLYVVLRRFHTGEPGEQFPALQRNFKDDIQLCIRKRIRVCFCFLIRGFQPFGRQFGFRCNCITGHAQYLLKPHIRFIL